MAHITVAVVGLIKFDALVALVFYLSTGSLVQGPLATLHGREEYSKAMQDWQTLLPERLENFEADV